MPQASNHLESLSRDVRYGLRRSTQEQQLSPRRRDRTCTMLHSRVSSSGCMLGKRGRI